MKIKLTTVFTNTITKILSNTPTAKLERKIDNFLVVVNRNKLMDYPNESIDEVVAFAKTKKIKHHVYF